MTTIKGIKKVCSMTKNVKMNGGNHIQIMLDLTNRDKPELYGWELMSAADYIKPRSDQIFIWDAYFPMTQMEIMDRVNMTFDLW